MDCATVASQGWCGDDSGSNMGEDADGKQESAYYACCECGGGVLSFTPPWLGEVTYGQVR